MTGETQVEKPEKVQPDYKKKWPYFVAAIALMAWGGINTYNAGDIVLENMEKIERLVVFVTTFAPLLIGVSAGLYGWQSANTEAMIQNHNNEISAIFGQVHGNTQNEPRE